MKLEERKQRLALTVLFTGVVVCFFIISLLVTGTAVFLLVRFDVLSGMEDVSSFALRLILIFALAAFIVSAAATFFLGKIPMRPINILINKMNALAAGNYKVRIERNGIMSKHPTVKEFTDSFNRMASELENTEMLRSDFINNFSHEFKTPIVSISGFAKLLKKGNLTREQSQEYIDIIEEESLRLSQMATNVLNLTKVENQTILTDVTTYNLSEQLRSCVLLLEEKWTRKNIEFGLEFDECFIAANEEMMKQVWINLIDNAVKFSPDYGVVDIRIWEGVDSVSVSVINMGSEIPQGSMDKIFNKFYQADESHAAEGNGIGLAVVKRVVSLHNGGVSVESAESRTEFTVTLPR